MTDFFVKVGIVMLSFAIFVVALLQVYSAPIKGLIGLLS